MFYTSVIRIPTHVRLKVGLWNGGHGVFGHEYLATYNGQYVQQCAKVAGVDLDAFKRTSIIDRSAIDKSAEEDSAGGMQPRSRFDAS